MELGKSFLYSSRVMITEAELTEIEGGHCPYRVNGTFSFSMSEGFNEENISDPASREEGHTVANATREYLERYGE